ncbi:hypothetical protein EDB19DRAFT_2032453 [Suillus lakei]|nr:hypothetical protein EDB19DRAFT_2032453 [Suillus lakei]
MTGCGGDSVKQNKGTSSSRPASRSPDPWRTSHPSQISRTLSPQPRRSIAPSTLAPAFSPASSARSTPVSSPRPLPSAADNAPSTSMAGMSKEEKVAEMARRKEERRLRIEKLKEQKKNAAAAGKV